MQPPYLPRAANGNAASDTIDVADVIRSVRRQWRAVLGFFVVGLVTAVGVILFAPRRFDGKASVLARTGSQNTSSISGRITGLGELLGGLGNLALGGNIETELQVLKSRALAGEVVDSLQLQIQVRRPAGLPPLALFVSSALPGAFSPRTYEFVRQVDGSYRTEQGGQSYVLQPGIPARLDVGTVTLRADDLPGTFEVKLWNREEAIDRFAKRLSASKAGGDIAKIVYRGDDSVTAPMAANVLVQAYIQRRRTVDRGVNTRRVEYVAAQLDSTASELARTEGALRAYQESSGIIDAEVTGEVEVRAAADLRRSLTELQVEEGAIRQLLASVASGGVTSRELAAYPAFLRGSSVSPLAQQLSDLEGQRIRLLERRTERDPEVVALDQTKRLLEGNILSMARSYAASITRQREQLQARVDSMHAALLSLPAAAERGGRLARDVKRLTQIYTALEAQLIEARLAAIGEGGEVRQVDVAASQRKPSFPKPWLTAGVGGAGGLLVGVIAALFLSWFGRWLRDPVEIERAVGVTAQRFEPNAPLLLAGAPETRSMLVIPLDGRAYGGTASVAERLARTARQRALHANVVNLAAGDRAALDSSQVSTALEQLEAKEGVTIVQLPELSSDITLAALRDTRPVILVAPPGPVDRTRLAHAVDTLRRLQIPCAGVVISDTPGPRALL